VRTRASETRAREAIESARVRHRTGETSSHECSDGRA